ncbi:MAG: hypothetical protein RBT65_08505 [Methanolobus sp.]|jgi:hypothetical protein|nr:hypothetical protein [Methanolobus sp.]
MDNKAQLHTLEGLGAAVMITFSVLTITQGITMMSPQNELSITVQMEQISQDALATLDIAQHASAQYNLTECIASWDMMEAKYPDNNLNNLDNSLAYLLPGVLYNVDIAYFKDENLNVKKVIVNGAPGKNAVVARHFVTLTNQTVQDMGGGWNLDDNELRVVEVRMTAWKV